MQKSAEGIVGTLARAEGPNGWQEGSEKELVKANDYDVSKGFEYFEVTKAVYGYPDRPDLSVLADLASLLVAELKSVCLNAS